jgi:GntR family transcriptional regulator of bglA
VIVLLLTLNRVIKGYISLLSNQGFKESLEDFNVTSKLLALEVRKPTPEALQVIL